MTLRPRTLFTLAAVALGFVMTQNSAFAKGSYGTTIDTYCTNNNRVPAKPYNGDCALCHLNYPSTPANKTDRVQPEWDQYLAGNYSYFCPTAGGANQAPNGTITAPTGTVTIASGQSVAFRGTGSDPDNNTPLGYSWDFGTAAPKSTLQNPTITFTNTGTAVLSVTVKLTVTDAKGLADPTSAQVTVQVQPGTTPSNTPPVATITSPANASMTVAVGQTVDFRGSATDKEGGTLAYLWDFGGAATVSNPRVQNPGAVTLRSTGMFQVRLTVTDPQGASGTDTLSLLVTNGTFGSCTDADKDGFSPAGGVCGPVDRNDANAAVNPGQAEICNDRVDNDGDGKLDTADEECIPDDQKTACELYFYGPCQYKPNQPPVAGNDTATVVQGQSVTVNVLANDSDPDGNPLVVGTVSRPANGTATPNATGGIVYRANAGFTGTDSFTYQVSDGTASASANVSVTVTAATPTTSVRITRAEWNSKARELKIRGERAGRDAMVTIVEVPSNATLGSKRAEDDGKFELTIRNIARPCSVKAVVNGASGAVRTVTNGVCR